MSLEELALTLGITLRDHQKGNPRDVVAWLAERRVAPERRGRTTYLAIHAIKKAMDKPGQSILVTDHAPVRRVSPAFDYARDLVGRSALAELFTFNRHERTVTLIAA